MVSFSGLPVVGPIAAEVQPAKADPRLRARPPATSATVSPICLGLGISSPLLRDAGMPGCRCTRLMQFLVSKRARDIHRKGESGMPQPSFSPACSECGAKALGALRAAFRAWPQGGISTLVNGPPWATEHLLAMGAAPYGGLVLVLARLAARQGRPRWGRALLGVTGMHLRLWLKAWPEPFWRG